MPEGPRTSATAACPPSRRRNARRSVSISRSRPATAGAGARGGGGGGGGPPGPAAEARERGRRGRALVGIAREERDAQRVEVVGDARRDLTRPPRVAAVLVDQHLEQRAREGERP